MTDKPAFEIISQHKCFDGTVGFYKHDSASTGTSMRFSVFVPKQGQSGAVPVLYYLAGLTCTEETFMIKAGAQRVAAELGLMLVAPDFRCVANVGMLSCRNPSRSTISRAASRISSRLRDPRARRRRGPAAAR